MKYGRLFANVGSKVDKYQKIIETKIKKYGSCKSIMISEIANKPAAILIQNAFPILEKYIEVCIVQECKHL